MFHKVHEVDHLFCASLAFEQVHFRVYRKMGQSVGKCADEVTLIAPPIFHEPTSEEVFILFITIGY